MRAIISRYAPAPTGFLHLGHVVNAVYVWGVTRRLHGRVLLRIEDHDRQRSRPEYDAAIVEDLAWLGFVADGPAVRQRDRDAIYAAALQSLREQGVVYACNCSRAARASVTTRATAGRPATSDELPATSDQLPATSNQQPASNQRPTFARASMTTRATAGRPATSDRYPGTCRDRGLREAPGLGLRVRLDPSVERFVDLRHGACEQQPSAQCGDLLVRDREGNWTYQFAATVDDWQQGVTLVIRGDDLLESTGRQLQLARLLGRVEPPRFLHHPLIMKSATQKLSKSDGDTGVRDLRARGWTPAAVIGQAAALAGLIPAARDVRAEEVSSIMSAFTERELWPDV